jgi:hypothetical protein
LPRSWLSPATAPLEAEVDPETGEITDGVLQVPAFETDIEEPTVAHVTVEFEIGISTGSFDQATGTLTLSGQAGGILTTEAVKFCFPAKRGGEAPGIPTPWAAEPLKGELAATIDLPPVWPHAVGRPEVSQ